MTGTVKKLLKDKWCGFIKGENGVEFFFHHSSLKNVKFEELYEGQDVTFEDVDAAKGPRAEDVYV